MKSGRGGWLTVAPCLAGDMYSHDGDTDEPEWVKTEREQFVEFRDKNRDGKMDKEETKDWILPSDYDHAEAEARHLVYESDQNKVGQNLLSPAFWGARIPHEHRPYVQAGHAALGVAAWGRASR